MEEQRNNPVRSMPAAITRSARAIGEDFTGWRKVLGLTAEQVADRADITRATLRKLEHGDPTVGFHVVLRVARALGVLDALTEAVDPLQTDLGRARADMLLRKRIR
ncbi:helix-turn-helix transcriptional regulator [Curtobacterium sp. MCSS17_006]|uniref:helix-turn-helix domain-containing protein n=1 Tax=Curtobacterium sp. MCSS17_006 TaxID=2175642 RepID=UPI0026D3385A|nr:helix-turn-helix transcriptional regulator [Curtobacterium sp. MCSS17_006]